MSISNKFDLAIKLAETKSKDGAYTVEDRKYETYMQNTEWEKFKADMTPTAFKEYCAGGGGELEEKNGRPPKMASYGSSSRMIYKLSSHKKEFHFEKKLPTTIGGTANLDGFYEDDNRYVFVEAKCHEIYSSKNSSVSKAYEKLYNFINEKISGIVDIKMHDSKCGRYLDVEYFAEGEKLRHFDMKQMICHLLGIATGILKGDLDKKQTDFIYLLYDPSKLELAPDTKEAVDSIYNRTCYEFNLVDYSRLLRVIFEFLKEIKYTEAVSDEELDALICKFTFTLTSQDFYPVILQ